MTNTRTMDVLIDLSRSDVQLLRSATARTAITRLLVVVGGAPDPAELHERFTGWLNATESEPVTVETWSFSDDEADTLVGQIIAYRAALVMGYESTGMDAEAAELELYLIVLEAELAHAVGGQS